MFRSHGFAGTGMRDIADAADLSPANLYHYFRGKDEILFYCQDRALDRMLDAVTGARAASGPAAARLQRVLAAHVLTMLDAVEGASAHVQIDSLPPSLRDRIVRKRDRYERGLRQLIEAGIARREFAAGDPALVTRAMLGAMNWTATWFRPDGRHDAATVGDGIAGFLVRGLEIPRASARASRANGAGIMGSPRQSAQGAAGRSPRTY